MSVNTAVPIQEQAHRVRLTINGRSQDVEVPPRRTLLHLLREGLHLTGTK